MIKTVLFVLLFLFIAVLGVGFFLPTAYAVERRVTIQATPAEIHALVGDLRQWPTWTPWQEGDPTMKTTYGETTEGVGASQTWTGKDGDGELTLTASSPETGIAYDMAFIMEGKRAPAQCAMRYEANGESTDVVWTMEGDLKNAMPPVMSGYMGLLMPGSVGGMFDRGLDKLRNVVEKK